MIMWFIVFFSIFMCLLVAAERERDNRNERNIADICQHLEKTSLGIGGN